ncbi:MAG: GNAT family N-acetyltransferase [Pseudomonadota bacterium]|nr:GNAT family N-acetyltransferase [Pseudomonadota bacterium]
MSCALLRKLMDKATAQGAGLNLSVLKANPARLLYERLGFVRVDESAYEHIMVRTT